MKKVIALKNGFENSRGKLVVEGRTYDVLDDRHNAYKIKDNQGGINFYPNTIFKDFVEEEVVVISNEGEKPKKKNKKKIDTEEVVENNDTVESDE